MPANTPDLCVARYRCRACPKAFSRPENLSRHSRSHKPQKSHVCHICGKQFTRSDVRQRHEQIHNAQRPAITRRVEEGPSPGQNDWTAIDPTGGPGDRVLGAYESMYEEQTMQQPLLFDGVPFPTNMMSILWDTTASFSTSPTAQADISPRLSGGFASRPSSPPNEASEEDKWPYRWNPGSRGITAAQPINLPHTHPLRRDHNPQFDISESRHARLKSYLLEPRQRGLGFHDLHLPELETLNIFIGLFFAHFEHQMPVIHRPSLQSPDGLPDALLAAIVAIGAIYSRVKHTSRFAIVLIDMARLGAQSSLELNNKLMRDPMFVYALVLLCYAGLWCGNKRLFELAENLRGTVVTYARHIQRSELAVAEQEEHEQRHRTADIQGQWQLWIQRESRKRLGWCIYALDCMFPSLLYLPPSLSLAEFMSRGCPCDEEYWHARTAYSWKSLLGSASVPPSRTFISAAGPFLGPLDLARQQHYSSSHRFRGLNPWTRYLILMTILVQVFELSQQINIASEATRDQDIWQTSESDTGELSTTSPSTSILALDPEIQPHLSYLETRCSSWRHSGAKFKRTSKFSASTHEILTSLAHRRLCVEKMLKAWEHSFASPPRPDTSIDPYPYPASDHYFHTTSLVLLQLGRLSLHAPISDLQSALGKAGPAEIFPAMQRMAQMLNRDPHQMAGILEHCLECVDDLQARPVVLDQRLGSGVVDTPLTATTTATTAGSPTTPTQQESSSPLVGKAKTPSEIITLFLSSVLLWMLVHCADGAQSRVLRDTMQERRKETSGVFAAVAGALDDAVQGSNYTGDMNDTGNGSGVGVGSGSGSHGRRTSRASSVLFAAADVLSDMAPWTASLNLALLLCHRGREGVGGGS
ncbi:fungal-specific transcription factor domain-containing protein [Aspergillus californicus]